MFLWTVKEYHQKTNVPIHGAGMNVCWSETHSSDVNMYPMVDLQPVIQIPWTTASTPITNTLHWG